MKPYFTTLTAAVVLLMASCNNQPKKADDKAAAPATSMAPYKGVIVQSTVKDYDAWYPFFTANDSVRKTYGLTNPGVGRELDNDKKVVIFFMASDIHKAKDFAASPGLKDVMAKAGVVDTPSISFVNVIFDDTSSIPQKERLMVKHHVKDFDAWKKGFDAEGDSVRAAFGVVKRAMTRDVDDPNTVTILFAVTDMAKAKARVESPELKKIMTDAGVDGPPQITWFKWVVM